MVSGFWRFPFRKNYQKSLGGLDLQLSGRTRREVKMNSQNLTFLRIRKMGEEIRLMEFSIARVITWALIFTNAYFLSWMISRLL